MTRNNKRFQKFVILEVNFIKVRQSEGDAKLDRYHFHASILKEATARRLNSEEIVGPCWDSHSRR